MVAEGDRLGRLQMGEARHDGRGMFVGAWRASASCSSCELAVERVDRVADPEAEIGRHLVVARARGMEPAGRRADQLLEPASMFMWMSSSAREKVKRPPSISAAICSRPLPIAAASVRR